MRPLIIAAMASICLAGCASLTPAQQSLVDQLGSYTVSAACRKIESEYAKVAKPSDLQQEAMSYVRQGCSDPAATVKTIQALATKLFALLPQSKG